MSVKVHLKGTGEVVEGSVFAVDPVTNTMVMESGQNYRIIMNSQIVKIEGEITEACAPGVPPSLVRYVQVVILFGHTLSQSKFICTLA